MTLSLIFDMDGTLFQTNTILESSLENTFDHLRNLELWDKETPVDKYREIMGVPLPVVWENLIPDNESNNIESTQREITNSLIDLPELRNLANDFFHEQLIANIKEGMGSLYPDVEHVFRYLKENNYSIYIASNGQVEYLNAIVTYYNLNEWVTETFSIQQVQTGDKADLVAAILKKYDIHKGAVIGDRLSDILAAKTNGLTAIGCNFDFAQPEELAQADIVIEEFLDLKKIFV